MSSFADVVNAGRMSNDGSKNKNGRSGFKLPSTRIDFNLKAIEEEAKANLEHSDIPGCSEKERRAHCASWEAVPESGNIPGVHVAKPTIGNALKAMRDRHFKIGAGVGVMTTKGKKHVQRACSLVKQALMESCVDSGALAFAFDVLEALPTEFKSGKWTEERYNLAMRAAGLDMPKELKRKAHVKPNEALSKEKPRMIITSGDEGVVRHILDSGLFEQRSLKHASRREFGRRMGEMLRCYQHAASMDFGAFDGSCTKEVRDLIENDILVSMFAKVIDAEGDGGLMYAAIKDRIKDKAHISVKNVIKAVIFDMIRESGDRGRMKDKAIKKLIAESLKSGSNLMGEGDDGLQVFERAFVELFGDKFTFGKEWCDGYKEYGFKIEPQGPAGDLEFHDCITDTSERVEFCSKIAVSVSGETYFFPKPSKLSNSLTASFDTASSRSDASYTKAVAMMSNCVRQPLLFALCRAMAREHRKEGAELITWELQKILGPREPQGEYGGDFEEAMVREYEIFLNESQAASRMMLALERETGISVVEQEEAVPQGIEKTRAGWHDLSMS
ncbi:unnamed protein product [Symbiodinium microadriaticum]|nr:unnamed protein product [Symbiodinium microadriaticum]